MTVAISSQRFGDEARSHALSDRPSEAPSDRPVRDHEEFAGDAHLRKPTNAARCGWLNETQTPSCPRPLGDFPNHGMKLRLGGGSIFRRSTPPCGRVLKGWTTPYACRNILGADRAVGGVAPRPARGAQ